METTEQYAASSVAFSPSGELLACVSNGKLRIQYAQSPERATEIRIQPQAKDVSAIRWSAGGTFISVLTSELIEVVDLEDDTHRVRLSNGSGGLGRFASADFIGTAHLLVTWDFGRAKLWNVQTGKGTELGDMKTRCEGSAWALRPSNSRSSTQTLAFLSRIHAQDHLTLHWPATNYTTTPTPLPTTDARGLYWSPDGHWLAIPDIAHARPSLHIYTPDGHKFRSHPAASAPDTASDIDADCDLGLKVIAWSPNSQLLALSRYDATVTLLNTRTFSPLAVVEHSTAITASSDHPVTIYQEHIDPSLHRFYLSGSLSTTQPISLPLSRPANKVATDPAELGIAECRFSTSGRYLATRDERTQSTVWIFDILTLQPACVLVQHSNVRRMQWSCSHQPNDGNNSNATQTGINIGSEEDPPEDILLLDCGESVAYLFSPSSSAPPQVLTGFDTMPAIPTFTFAPSPSTPKPPPTPTLLASTKTIFRLLYPFGRSFPPFPTSNNCDGTPSAEEDANNDSLLEILTGRKPAPPRTDEPSYTEQIDWEAEAQMHDDAEAGGLDDTFRAKRLQLPANVGLGEEKDPLDDSEIF